MTALGRRTAALVRAWALLLVLLAVLGALGAYLVTSRASTYRAVATLGVGRKTPVAAGERSGQAILAFLVARYATTPVLLTTAEGYVGVGLSSRNVTATVVDRSDQGDEVRLAVESRNPLRAEVAADALAQTIAVDAGGLPALQVATGDADLSPLITVVRHAAIPTTPVTRHMGRNLLLGLLLTPLVGVLIILPASLGLASETVGRLEAEVELPLLAVVPRTRRLPAPLAPNDLR